MLKIKLRRIGKKKQPQYRIVVCEAKSKINGKYLESLGFYNPLPKKKEFKLDKARYLKWLQKGAIPTPTVAKLAKK